MKPGLVAGVAAFFVLVAAVLVALLLGPGLLASGTSTVNLHTNVTSGNVIVLENAHQGTNSWQIPRGKEATIQIQAYASATSVLPGQKLTFYVSTQKEGILYSVDIYRLGWYEGYGGRLMASEGYQTGHAQGYYADDQSDTLLRPSVALHSLHTSLVGRYRPNKGYPLFFCLRRRSASVPAGRRWHSRRRGSEWLLLCPYGFPSGGFLGEHSHER